MQRRRPQPSSVPPVRVQWTAGPASTAAAASVVLQAAGRRAEDEREEKDLDRLYRSHAARVLRWAQRLLGPTAVDEADDVVHDVFSIAQRMLPGFRGDAEVTTWLHRITVRVVQRHRLRTRRWQWFRAADGQEGERAIRLALHLRAAAPTAGPDATMVRRQQTQALYAVLDQLKNKHRTTLILFELEELSGEEIASITGTTVGNVWVRLNRARKEFLQKYLEWKKETAG